MDPFGKSGVVFPSFPILESQTALGIGATFLSNPFDTVDLLRTRHASSGFSIEPASGALIYTRDPQGQADPRYFCSWTIHATAAAGPPARGYLEIRGAPVNPASGLAGTFFTARTVHYAGPPFNFSGGLAPMVSGGCLLSSRMVQFLYRNGPVAQVTFSLGIYLRPIL